MSREGSPFVPFPGYGHDFPEYLFMHVDEQYQIGCSAFDAKEYEDAEKALGLALNNIDILECAGIVFDDNFIDDVRYKHAYSVFELLGVRRKVHEQYQIGCSAFDAGEFEKAKDALELALKTIDNIAAVGLTVFHDNVITDIRYKYAYSVLELPLPDGVLVDRQCDQILQIKENQDGRVHFLKARGLLVTDNCELAIHSAEKAKKVAQARSREPDLVKTIEQFIKEANKKRREVDPAWLKGTHVPGVATPKSRTSSGSKKNKNKTPLKSRTKEISQQQSGAAKKGLDVGSLGISDILARDEETEGEEGEASEWTGDEEDDILVPVPDPTRQPGHVVAPVFVVEPSTRGQDEAEGSEWKTYSKNRRTPASSSKKMKAASKASRFKAMEPFVKLPPFPDPIGNDFDRELACFKCWKKEGLGPVGGTRIPHNPGQLCKRNVLIFRQRGETNWHVLRPRPPLEIREQYQTCLQFAAGVPCKKGKELKCTSVHHTLELVLWMYDRDCLFSISNFIHNCQKIYEQRSGRFFGPDSSSVLSQSMVPRPTDQFPLERSHEFRICCTDCLRQIHTHPHAYSIDFEEHDCAQNVLAVRSRFRGNRLPDATAIKPWVRVRERVNFRRFRGTCGMCWTVDRPRAKCQPTKEECCFTHSSQEQLLWTADKDGSFSISDFIKAHTSSTDPPLRRFLRKYPGSFLFLCRQCSNRKSKNGDTCQSGHNWAKCKALGRRVNRQNTVIHTRPDSLPSSGNVERCRNDLYCESKKNGTCPFVHTQLEKDFWELGITQDQLVAESEERSTTRGAKNISRRTDVKPSEPCIVELDCPFMLELSCGTCWEQRHVNPCDERGDKCSSREAHDWATSSAVCVCLPAKMPIRPLPSNYAEFKDFTLCKSITQGRKCPYPDTCPYGFSQEEVDVWAWMRSNKVRALEEAVRVSKEWQQEKGGSAATPVYYCGVCNVEYCSQEEIQDHFVSPLHTEKVNSDKDQQWNYRRPPFAVDSLDLKLCLSHDDGRKCLYSKSKDIYNLCEYAHCQDELDEWRTRVKHLQMKREMAAQLSYMDQLCDEFNETIDHGSVMTEEMMPGMKFRCLSELTQYQEDTAATQNWTFKLSTPKRTPLVKVALLHNKNRLHFSLVKPSAQLAQVASGSTFSQPGAVNSYVVPVKFQASMFGSFSQTIVFDFGFHPVLTRTLRVEVGSQDQLEELRELRRKLSFRRWTPACCEIELFSRDVVQNEKELLQTYKAPESEEDVIDQDVLSQELNSNNYIHLMKKHLRLEEFERYRILSRYNLETSIECIRTISEVGVGLVNSKGGELFAKVPLQESITEDTDAGRLILSSVTHVLLAPTKSNNNIVYEALIVNKERFDFEGRNCDHIYICLSDTAVEELGVKDKQSIEVKLQFQMDRLPFCRMYRALDNLGEDRSLLFPDVEKARDVWKETSTATLRRSEFLNESQLTVARYVTAPHSGYTPPLVVYGPFGTGKTETFAHCAAYLAQKRSEVRVLICTHSNSAADLYVTRLKTFSDRRPFTFCRIYGTHRRVNMPDEVREHCFLYEDRTGFPHPTVEVVQQHKIVIMTLSSSLMIAREAQLKGLFTHIFIDEAAQTLEAEAIMPLALAVQGTCVVLAGDYEQLSPPVYSKHDRCRVLRCSILHRLLSYYESHEEETLGAGDRLTASPFTVLLSANYRSRKQISNFLSGVFYEGKIQSLREDFIGDIPAAIAFYTSKGEEKIPENGTSYINIAEVQEVALRVEELMRNWPEDEWGEPDQSKVAVVTPYSDQVEHIRYALGKKKLNGVHTVSVYDIQGKEFFAVFISTVRTIKPEDNLQRTETPRAEDAHLGFLSNKQLLNTALTRARDCVAVVGDPEALLRCSTSAVWRLYLQHCDVSGSFFPKTLTLAKIEDELQASLHRSQSSRSVGNDATVSRASETKPDTSEARLFKDFELKRQLGKGGFGTVFEVRKFTDKKSYAVKMIRLPHKYDRRDQVLREAEALASLRHPGIVRYFYSWEETLLASFIKDVRKQLGLTVSDGESSSYESDSSYFSRTEDNSSQNFTQALSPSVSDPSVIFVESSSDKPVAPPVVQEETTLGAQEEKKTAHPAGPREFLFIQTELCKQETLKDWLKNTKLEDRTKGRDMFFQIVCAIEHVHSEKFMHRDLSPKNIFFSLEDDGKVKVGDFGLARASPEDSEEEIKGEASCRGGANLSKQVGTMLYMSPEQRAGKKYADKVDVYALGVIFLEMLMCFGTDSERYKMLENAKQGNYPKSFCEKHPAEVELVRSLLHQNPEERPTAADLSRQLRELAAAPRVLEAMSAKAPEPKQLEDQAGITAKTGSPGEQHET